MREADTLPRKLGENFTDWILRWLVDAEMRRTKEFGQRVDRAREADANHYAVREFQ